MGSPELPETTEAKNKPLKFFRPPLQSDRSSLVEKISQLSLQDRLRLGTIGYERPADVNLQNVSFGISSSCKRNTARSSQQRLQTRSRSSNLPQKYASHKYDGNNTITGQEQTSGLNHDAVKGDTILSCCLKQSVLHLDPEQSVGDIACCSNNKKETTLHHTACHNAKKNGRFQQVTCNGLCLGNHLLKNNKVRFDPATRIPANLRRPRADQEGTENWRLKAYSSGGQDSDSVIDSSVKNGLTKEEKKSRSLNMRNVAMHDILNHSDISYHSFDKLSCDNLNATTDISCDQSSDEVECLNLDDPVPQPIQLLLLPDHLRFYTPSFNMQRTSSPADSGMGSDWLQDGTISPVPKDACKELSTQTVVTSSSSSSTKSINENSPLNTTADSFDTSQRSSTSNEKVLGSRGASLFSQPLERPVISHLHSTEIHTSTSVSASSESNLNEETKSSLVAMGLPSTFGTPNVKKRKAVDSSQICLNLQEQERICFSKTFKFRSSDWSLPDPGDLFLSKPWVLEKFLDLKQKLNSVKDELNDLSLQDWHAHTRRRNKAGNVIWHLRQKIDPEFATQAWCKFYENVSNFPLVPQKAVDAKTLRSVHLCEAPGAFIASLNHFLLTNYGSDFDFDWRAVTLNPYYEGNPLSCMINDDRLILKTLDKWLFGQDNTGDLMIQENLVNMTKEASQLGQVLLITADGSFDCQDNPAEQEDLVSWLHICETVAALQMLAPGGSFLLKMFTFYEHSSICLLYLLNCVFKSVMVNKPVTSKEGNSEVYVVCCDYTGLQKIRPWLDVLMDHYGQIAPENALFSLTSIPNSFLDQLFRCADFFRRMQTDVIRENIRSFHHPGKKDSYFTSAIRHRVAEKFFNKYKVKKLDRSLYLVDRKQLKDATTPNIDPKSEEGSFNDRRKRLSLSPEEELKYIKDDLRHLDVTWPGDFEVFWLDFPEKPKGFKIVRGKPITKVNSSKFCLGRLLKLRNRVREIALDHFHVEVSQKNSGCDTREFSWPDDLDCAVKRKVTTLNFQNKLWASLEDGSNATNEKNACRKILLAIEHEVFRDDCLELKGYPLLTQFNVGLVFVLGHLFEKVGFVRPQGQDIRVLFYNYRKFNPEMKRHWDEVVSVMDHDSEAVLSVIQISELSDGDFYKYVTEINNLCVVEQILDLLNVMSAQLL